MPDSNQGERFMQLVAGDQHRVMSCIYALVHNLHDTDDLYQQTLEILWRKFDQYDPSLDFGRWACGVARGEVANFLRKRTSQQVTFSTQLVEQLTEHSAGQPAERSSGVRSALGECLEKLGEADRELLDMVYGGRHTTQQTAEQLGRTVQGVYNSTSRIRRILLECVERRLAQEDHP